MKIFLNTTDINNPKIEITETKKNTKIIKNEFGLSIKAYLIPEFTNTIFGTTSELTKELTPSRVVFGFEGDATDEQVGKK